MEVEILSHSTESSEVYYHNTEGNSAKSYHH